MGRSSMRRTGWNYRTMVTLPKSSVLRWAGEKYIHIHCDTGNKSNIFPHNTKKTTNNLFLCIYFIMWTVRLMSEPCQGGSTGWMDLWNFVFGGFGGWCTKKIQYCYSVFPWIFDLTKKCPAHTVATWAENHMYPCIVYCSLCAEYSLNKEVL